MDFLCTEPKSECCIHLERMSPSIFHGVLKSNKHFLPVPIPSLCFLQLQFLDFGHSMLEPDWFCRQDPAPTLHFGCGGTFLPKILRSLCCPLVTLPEFTGIAVSSQLIWGRWVGTIAASGSKAQFQEEMKHVLPSHHCPNFSRAGAPVSLHSSCPSAFPSSNKKLS